jgi:hemoglobin
MMLGTEETAADRQRSLPSQSSTADDGPFREAVRTHHRVRLPSRPADSRAKTDADIHPLREVPRWTWPANTVD